MALKTAGKNDWLWNVRTRKQTNEGLVATLSALHSGCTGLVRRVSPTLELALLKLARKVWVGHSPL